MKLLNAFLIAAVLTVAAACSKNEPVKIIETPIETVYSGTHDGSSRRQGQCFRKMSMPTSVLKDDGTATSSSSTRSSSVPQMPVSLDVTVPGVKCEIRENEIILSGNDIVPLAMGTLYAKI